MTARRIVFWTWEFVPNDGRTTSRSTPVTRRVIETDASTIERGSGTSTRVE